MSCNQMILVRAAVIGLACSSIFAGPAEAAVEGNGPTAGAARANTSVQSLQEVVVTAQRRRQRLQDVPITVSAFTSQQMSMRGITSTRDLDQTVPGLLMTTAGTAVQPIIRGLGTSATLIGQESSVAVYLDGVYMPMSDGDMFYDLANVESVQVLKGPQGVLFGRNANAGAILITTSKPRKVPDGRVSVSYGNFNAVAARGFLAAPITDTVGISLAANYERHDGWFRSLVFNTPLGKGNTESARAALYIDPVDRLNIMLSLYYGHLDDPTSLLLQPSNGYLGWTPGAIYPTSPYDNISGNHIGQTAQQLMESARITYTFDEFELTSTTAYQSGRRDSIDYDSDTIPPVITTLQEYEQTRDFSQEFLLNSTATSNFKWTIGAFYFWQNAGMLPLNVVTRTITIPLTGHRPQRALAGFGNFSYRFGNFEASAGVRYNHESASYHSFVALGRGTALNGGRSWNSITPRYVLSYHLGERGMIYASYSQGFKAGATNIETLTPTILNPETVRAWEAGIKLASPRGITFDGAVFLNLTKDLQLQALNPVVNVAELINAGALKSYGADFDLAWHPTANLNTSLGVELLRSRFTNFPNAQIFVPVPTATPGFDNGNASVVEDVKGKDGIKAPGVSADGSISYDLYLDRLGTVVPSVNVAYTSSFYWDPSNRLKEKPHTIVNAQLEWDLPGDHFSVTGWARNLTNELRFENVSPSGVTDRRLAAMPRTYGVKFDYRF